MFSQVSTVVVLKQANTGRQPTSRKR